MGIGSRAICGAEGAAGGRIQTGCIGCTIVIGISAEAIAAPRRRFVAPVVAEPDSQPHGHDARNPGEPRWSRTAVLAASPLCPACGCMAATGGCGPVRTAHSPQGDDAARNSNNATADESMGIRLVIGRKT